MIVDRTHGLYWILCYDLGMSDLVHNERTKLIATLMNNVGVAVIVSGTIAPLFGSVFGLAHASTTGQALLAYLVSAVVGISLHVGALFMLGRLVG